MLRLKRVELQGFKSFCDRSEMRFHGSGVAAIVGPNGCGKSNLSDAISWVLGEQSAKTLRGSRMEDVIFAGTRDRKPVGMASVTMTLVDPGATPEFAANGNGAETGHAPSHSLAKLGEITVTRRLYRSGESEYLINGRQARLRDIQDIFMGTGLGPESYAIIEQGRIGQILSTKPQDRRAVLEEAAGVTRFKTKKRLSEAKLEGAKANLNRVFDILEEVGRQVNTLKRQAAKAKRFAELRADLVVQLRSSLSGRFRMLERDAAKTALDLNLAAQEFQELSASVAMREREQSRLQENLYEIERNLTDARRMLAEKRVEAERVRGRFNAQSHEIETIEQRLARGGSEQQDLEQRFEQQQGELAAFSDRAQELEQLTEEARRALALKSEERDRAQALLRDREKGIETTRQLVLKVLGEASSLKNQLAQVDQFLLGLQRDLERIGRDESAASGEIERLEKLKAELAERQRSRQLELLSTAEQRQIVDEELATRKSRSVEARRTLEELRGESSRLKARQDSLSEILSHRTYTAESVKRLFKAVERGELQGLRPLGVLADFVEVDPAHEKAVEEFLHEELEYVIVQALPEAEQGLAFMRASMDGRASFLVCPEPAGAINRPGEEEGRPAPTSGIVAKLTDVLRLTNYLGGMSPEVLPRLARCYLTADHEQARQLSLEHPELYFLQPDGVCYQGAVISGGKKTGSGPLGLKRELREVSDQYTIKQKQFEKTKNLLDDLDREMAHLLEDLERLRSVQQKQEKEAVALDHEARRMSDEYSRANQRLSVARLEIQRLHQERERSTVRRAEIDRSVAEKDQARAAHEQVLAETRAALDDVQQEMSRIAEEHSAFRVELAGLEERRRSEQAARNRLEHHLRETVQRRQYLAGEVERLRIEKARLTADNLELGRAAAVFTEGIESGEAKVKTLAEEEQAGRTSWAKAEEILKGVRQDVQTASDRRSQTELQLVKKQSEIRYLQETCRNELGATLEEVSGGDETILDEVALADAEHKYQDLRAKIEALGPVNTQALEEFEDAQQRYDFLNAQRQDLLDSIRDTEKTIKEIDAESRKRFSEAFEAINLNFREMFKTLFGGGIGEMRLNDEENVSDSGIDIVASPPGKKLQSVLLLSGGERALTAMALLMAIFKYQPSPFCVLDEVDAPLDEANIERMTRLVKQMSTQTQFIVITHAKRTMEAAQALYGVTMQEPGVSKLVSVRFSTPVPTAVPALETAMAAG